MEIANIGGRLNVVLPEGGVDVERASDGKFSSDPAAVYERWDDFREWSEGLTETAQAYSESDLGPPSPMPRQVFGVGANYRAHIEEAGAKMPTAITVFSKFPTCLVGPNAEVALPSESVDWEAELVLIISKRGFRVAPEAAWDHIAGLTVGQDLSERVVQMASSQFCLAKSYPGFGPTGPRLVTPDSVKDRDDLEIICTVAGQQMQHGRTSDMIYPVPEIIARISAVCPLLPGDVIFTGTPSGVGLGMKPPRYLKPGEEVVTEIVGIGEMRNRFVGSNG